MDDKQKDLELWRQWKKTKSPADLELLMAQVMPVLRREVSRWSNIVPAFVLEAEAKKIALGAFGTFDPNRGVALSTHVTNALQKLSRTAYARQSLVGIPEHQRLTYNKYTRVKAQLEDELGHPPSIDHVADHLGLPPAKLTTLIHNVERKEFMESGEGPTFQARDDDDIIHLAYHDMTPQQKRIFELRTGYNPHGPPDPHKIKGAPAIRAELNLTQGQLSYELKKIKDLLERAKALRL